MNFKIFSTKEFDIKKLKPRKFDVSRLWIFAILGFFAILVLGILISLDIFMSIYTKEYKLKTESVEVEKINVERLKKVVEQRKQFMNETFFVPIDPSL